MTSLDATVEKRNFHNVPGEPAPEDSDDLELNSLSPNKKGNEEGIPWVWVTGGAMASILFMMVCLFGIVVSQGLLALWPKTINQYSTSTGEFVGVPYRRVEDADSEKKILAKFMIYTANRDFGGNEFEFVGEKDLKETKISSDLWYVERQEWGPFIGHLDIVRDGSVQQENASEILQKLMFESKERTEKIKELEKNKIGDVNAKIEQLRIDRRGVVRRGRPEDKEFQAQALSKIDQEIDLLSKESDKLSQEAQILRAQDLEFQVTLRPAGREGKAFPVSQIVRAFRPNDLSFAGKMKIFLSRGWEFLSQEPREANTAGGVFPALFGTVIMTLIMTVAILPFGVLTAVYMREIAKQGVIVSFVRVAVGNLAGVPSIVYGVFGLGFFCYTLGVSIDQLFFVDRLPSPTFGTGGILWASLTLSLLTVPVVIVSTEEALSSVPRTLREASYGCGATRLQTLVRIVLPKATPGIMTGLILAMARGAGEVAPLLVTGVVKLAPALPVDSHFPYVHLERSFMHLGFHIFDLGFQSRSTEASRPMVFMSTFLLIGLVLTLNFAAVKIRSTLRRRFEGRGAF
jgi:phosphate transport system permease protein